ncbi:MAG: pyruvate carboxylase subunit B [Verrucomicrobiae bacterium]|nr:pyruvate carboxylase subunit B [Verrucomicrobiae bacterium]
MKTKPVLFNNTVLRDGHQSMAATRMATAQMLSAAPILDEMGFAGLETWGGATIDSCLRYLNENPFDRLRTLKKIAPRTPQLTLLRGQNIVQYASFPDDVVETFVRLTCANGQDILRIFDALNDVRNLQTAIQATKKYGKHARGELCYTISPVHTVENFVTLGVALEKLGCDSIGIKDMSGIIQPQIAYRLVKELKGKVGVPITLHTHDTGGLGAASYLAAIDAGVDCVEVSIVPFANGTSQPDTQRMLALLEGHPRCPKFDTEKLAKLREYFEGVYKELSKFTSPANERVDSDILIYQVPGGMLSNFRTQLKEQGMADKFDQVVKEIPIVRAALGWIPLVTPTSQIVGTQAMMNLKFGRWKMICQPAQDIALGKYGQTPGPIDPNVLAQVEKQTGKKRVTERPADLLEPGLKKYRKQCAEKGLPTDDETVVLFAMFPQQVEDLHQAKSKSAAAPAATSSTAAPAAPVAPASGPPGSGAGRHLFVTVNGKRHDVTMETVEG